MPQTTIGSFIAGGLAACGAVTVTNPFEVVKTRYGAPISNNPNADVWPSGDRGINI